MYRDQKAREFATKYLKNTLQRLETEKIKLRKESEPLLDTTYVELLKHENSYEMMNKKTDVRKELLELETEMFVIREVLFKIEIRKGL